MKIVGLTKCSRLVGLMEGVVIRSRRFTSSNYLVVISKVAIRDGDCSRSLDGVDEAIRTFRHGEMIKPNIPSSKDANSIAFISSP
mgnify:CR=1 FL=1